MDHGPLTLQASVIILNYNGASILPVIRQGILGVQQQSFRDWELILVDDGSTDGSNEFLAGFADGKRIRFVQALHRGVGAARNAGIRAARGQYIAFLDNDAIPDHDWLGEVVGFFEAHSECGALASLVFFADRPGVINSAGSVLNEMAHGTGVCMHELLPFAKFPTDIMYATGNGMAIRRTVLEQIGGFDEGFLYYGHDDSDMGVLIRNAGYAIVPIPSARVQHLHSTSKRQPGMSFWDQRNRLRFALKHYGTRKLLWFVGADVKHHLFSPYFKDYLRAWRSALQGWRSVWRYRKRAQSLEGYFEQFATYFMPERRYFVSPDNRGFSQEWTRFSSAQPLIVGDNEEQYLYQGWYWRQMCEGQMLRWAMPVASLRFATSQPLHHIRLTTTLPAALTELACKLHVYTWSDTWFNERPTTVNFTLKKAQPSFEIHLQRPIMAERVLLVFEAGTYYQEPGYFPRRLAFGMSRLEIL